VSAPLAPVFLVQSSGSIRSDSWPEQRTLRQSGYELRDIAILALPDGRPDFEHEAAVVETSFRNEPAHLVAHSYGAVGALLWNVPRFL
jgi:hypothetical protein